MKTLYLDCGMGAAGDMLVSSLIELIPDRKKFILKMNALGIPDVRIQAETAEKCGIRGTHYSVTVGGIEESHDSGGEQGHEYDHVHDGEYVDDQKNEHSHKHADSYEDECSYEHANDHEDEHNHECGHEHHHEHSSMEDIKKRIDILNASKTVKEDILSVYSLIANAESQAHGKPVSDIHFHEVGTGDAIADIAAFCLLVEEIAPERIIASPVRTGFGTVRCAHGILPVPAPATARLLTGIPSYAGDIRGEMCTPTGAALLKYFVSSYEQMPLMRIEKIGYGMGKKNFETANCVRAILGESYSESKDDSIASTADQYRMNAEKSRHEQRGEATEDPVGDKKGEAAGESGPGQTQMESAEDSFCDQKDLAKRISGLEQTGTFKKTFTDKEMREYTDTVAQLVCNLDDMTPEAAGFARDILMDCGALEVYTVPADMKKNRPGILLTVLCKEEEEPKFVQLIFKYTTSIGIRETICRRFVMKRKNSVINTTFGSVHEKISEGYGVQRIKPEYEEVVRIAREKYLSYEEVTREIERK